MRRSTVLFAILCLFGTVSIAQAQNLLVNGNLDGSSFTYYDGFDPSIADDVPGWLLSLGAADGSYILVSPDPNPLAGSHDADMGIGPSGGAMQTAPLSRPAVTPSLVYRASVTSDNYFSSNTTSYFIDWYDGGGSLISSVGAAVTDLNGPFTYLPYTQKYVISGTAPGTAASAAVRFTSGDGTYSGLAADHFFFGAVPEPGSAVLLALGAFGLFATARRKSR